MKKTIFISTYLFIVSSILFSSFSFAAEDLTIVNKNTNNPTINYKGQPWLGTGPIDEHRLFNWKWGSTWFKHKPWLDYMKNNKFNFGRVFAMSGWPYYDHKKDPASSIFPFAIDHWRGGDPVVDLLQMDAIYWNNFSRVLKEAEDRGIVIIIQLYQKHSFNGKYKSELFFGKDNNINGVNITDNKIWKAMSNAYPNGTLWKTHRNWVNQILDAIGDRKNVMIDLMNEPDIKTIGKEWINRTLDLIEAWESANNRDLLVGMDIDHVLSNDSTADKNWVLGHPRMELIVGEDHWIYDRTSQLINYRKEYKKPMVWVNEKANGYVDSRILTDSPSKRRHYLWLGMMTKIQGLGLYDKNNHTQQGYLKSSKAAELGKYNEILFKFFEKIIIDYSSLNAATNIIDSAPKGDSKVSLSSSNEVVVYLHKGFGSSQASGVTLKLKNLSLPTGDVDITFFHPINGNISSQTKNLSGNSLNITLPKYTENVAIYIKPSGISVDPPAITAELQDQIVTVGQTAAFSVTATGASPLSYQWQKNNVDITDAPNSPSYITSITTLSDSGNQYRCIVSNNFGTTTTNSATLTVIEPSGDEHFVESNGQVVMEVGHFDTNTPQGGHQWVVDTTPGFSGANAMEASPNNGTNHRTNYAANSPRLDFQVNFASTGKYFIWVRGVGPGGGSNSLHVGLNGQEITTSAAINLTKKSGYVWSNGNHFLQIPSAGVHTINVWMREDGTIFDKLVLTTNSGFTPSGNGPAESPRGETGGNQSPILNSIGSQSVEEEQALSFTVSASDPDGPTPILSASPLPPEASFSAGSGLFSWTPPIGANEDSPYTLTVRATDATDPTVFDEEIVNITVTSSAGNGNGGFQQDGSGLVAMEAEHFDANSPQGGQQWVVNSTSGFSGTSAMEASPNNGTNHRTNYAANSPRLDFQVNFTNAGTHFIWVRGVGPGGGSNSLHVGLNGQEITTSAAISLTKKSGYVWSNGNHSLQIPSAGVHTINVWMREDGTLFDKLVLSTDSGFTPSGNGPAESPRGEIPGGMPVTITACLSTEDLPIDLNNFVTDDDTMLGFSIETQPTKGNAILQPDGTLTSYIPNAGSSGFDSFTYQVDDHDDGVAIGTVNIAVSRTRIMPLGDSITAGDGLKGAGCSIVIPDEERIGYREKLFTDLGQDSYMVDFVGSLASGLSATPPIEDPHHEGIGGNEASQVLERVIEALILNPANIVLLHIGTNNINSDDPNQTIIDIENILDAIDTWEASNNEVTVLLSTIIERSTKKRCNSNPVYNNAKVNTLNGLISNLVASRTSDKLVLVDQREAINNPTTQISKDGVHLSPSGYERMAEEWFDKLTDASNNIDILRCPTSN